MGWWIRPLSPGLQFTLTMKPSAQGISLEDVGPHTQFSDFYSSHLRGWSPSIPADSQQRLHVQSPPDYQQQGSSCSTGEGMCMHTHTHTHTSCSSYTRTQRKGSRTKWPSPSSSPEGDRLLPEGPASNQPAPSGKSKS